MMGFPCQPHSVQGQRRGSDDPRAEVLWHGLHIAFMLQVQTVILECTPIAGRNPDIQHALATLAAAMGWTVLTTELDLLDIWPCRRHRWWALLLPTGWNKKGLHAWTFHTPFDHFGALISAWGRWSPDEERELQLTQHELTMYHDVHYGHDQRHLQLEGISSTILHSYANALGPCPCGCRSQAFHDLTLRQGGLRGFYVTSGSTGKPRHLHPREAGLLLGVPDSVRYPHDVKTSLCLLGLIASPIQVIWIYGWLQLNHSIATAQGPSPSPEDWIWTYLRELLAQIKTGFGFADAVPRALACSAFGAPLRLPIEPDSVTVRALLQAERISLGWDHCCALWHDDQRLRCDDNIMEFASSDLQLLSSAGVTGRAQPSQPIAIAVLHEDTSKFISLSLGAFSLRFWWTCGCH